MISICVPTRGRPARFRKMVESAQMTAAGPIEICAWLDQDDRTAARYPQSGVTYGSGIRTATTSILWNRAWSLATGDIAMLCGDDVIFKTGGWDLRVQAEFDRVRDGILMVYTDDGSRTKRPVMPFVSRTWIDQAGEFTPPNYEGWFADEWIWSMAAELDRWVYLPDVLIRHYQTGGDPTYRDGKNARQRAGGLEGMAQRFYSLPEVRRRDEQTARLRAVCQESQDSQVKNPDKPEWARTSLALNSLARNGPLNDLNPSTLVTVHCYAGDADQVQTFLPVYQHHGTPVLVMSPSDSPVRIDAPGVRNFVAGQRGYFGQGSLDRQRLHLEKLLEEPFDHFLLNDADSFCISPQIPRYVYEEDVLWSNEATESRPHESPYPKLGLHPPYFMSRAVLEQLLTASTPEAHPITPFIDWMMIAMAHEAGVKHKTFRDGADFPAWRHDAIPETKALGHDYEHVNVPRGRQDGAAAMKRRVSRGAVFIHSVKHPEVLNQLVRAHHGWVISQERAAARKRHQAARVGR